MVSDRNLRRRPRNQMPTLAADRDLFAQQRLCSRSTEANDHLGTNQIQLSLEPRPANRDLAVPRILVNAPFSAFFETECLHRVGEIDFASDQPGRIESLSNIFPAGPTKGRPTRS